MAHESKEYEVNYFTTFRVEAEDKKQAELVGDKLLEEELKIAVKSNNVVRHFSCEVEEV